jgi:hypothetical protein
MKWQNINVGLVFEGVEVLSPIGYSTQNNQSNRSARLRWNVRCTVCANEYGARAANIAKGTARCMLCRKTALDAQESK